MNCIDEGLANTEALRNYSLAFTSGTELPDLHCLCARQCCVGVILSERVGRIASGPNAVL